MRVARWLPSEPTARDPHGQSARATDGRIAAAIPSDGGGAGSGVASFPLQAIASTTSVHHLDIAMPATVADRPLGAYRNPADDVRCGT